MFTLSLRFHNFRFVVMCVSWTVDILSFCYFTVFAMYS